jgi:hypothetical protein
MAAPGRAANSRRDPNGPTWRTFAIAVLAILVATVVAVAALATLPMRTVNRTGTAWSTEELPGNYTGPWWTYRVGGDPPLAANISLPTGANATSIVAHFGTVGGWRMNLSVGNQCAFRAGCLPAGPPPPPGNWLIYSVANATQGDFGWACEVHWSCNFQIWLHTSGTASEAWTLTWEVAYNYTATEPLL